MPDLDTLPVFKNRSNQDFGVDDDGAAAQDGD